MNKILSCTAAIGLLVASSSGVLAKGLGGVTGASSHSPGLSTGPAPVPGLPGRAGWAPGQQMLQNGGPTAGNRGASTYAPGVYAPGFNK